MAQEFTITISDALWASVQSDLSNSIDSSLTGNISVERMTTFLNDMVASRLQTLISHKKVREFKKDLGTEE